jgi:hypothetical protein
MSVPLRQSTQSSTAPTCQHTVDDVTDAIARRRSRPRAKQPVVHFSTPAASVEYFRARRVSAALLGGKNVRWSRSAQERHRAP